MAPKADRTALPMSRRILKMGTRIGVWAVLPILTGGLAGCTESITSGFAAAPEVYRRDVGFDVHFCMRVVATPIEVERFVSRNFSAEERVAAHPDDMFQKSCGAEFWPQHFVTPTAAYKKYGIYGTSGAVVQNGYLYYWDIAN